MNDRRKVAEKSLNAFFGKGPSQDLSPRMRDALARLEEAAKPRSSNIGSMPLAGAYLYTDFPGADPVEVTVAVEYGITLVRFPPLDGDEGAELLLKDMAACGNWREHFRRIEPRSPSGLSSRA